MKKKEKANINTNRLLSSYVISYSQGATINVGNYETRRVTIGISIPFLYAKSASKVLKMAKNFVEKALEKEIKEIEKKYEGSRMEIKGVCNIDEVVIDEEV